MLSKKGRDPARHAEDKQNTERNGTKNKDGLGQQENWKTNLEMTNILETEMCSRQFEQGYRNTPFWRQASYVHGYDGFVHGQGFDRRLTTYHESLFNVKKGNIAEAKAAVDF